MKRNQPSPASDSELCISSSDGRPAKKAKISRQSSSSAASPATFMDELIEPVLAQLSMSQIEDLKRDSQLWAAMLQTSSLKRACATAHPKLFGLVGWNLERDGMWTTLFDMKSKEWINVELTEFPLEPEYEDAMCASDGGLVCFVPRSGKKLAAAWPILVCNPLTNDCKFLPLCSRRLGKRHLLLVQLVVNEDNKCYRVILVYAHKSGETHGAVFYDSRIKSWSTMNAGLVYGAGNTLLCGRRDPHVFHSEYQVAHNVNLGITLRLPGPRSYSLVKDHLFMLDAHSTPGMCQLTECDWETYLIYSIRTLQTHSVSMSGLSEEEEYHPVLLPCSSFILLAWDNDDDDNHGQLFKLYDRSANEWHDLPTLVEPPKSGETTLEELKRSLMCDLRWDAIP